VITTVQFLIFYRSTVPVSVCSTCHVPLARCVYFLDTQKKREAKKAEKAAKKATHKAAAADGGDAGQEQDDGPDISVGK
jgi:hypothetical protein